MEERFTILGQKEHDNKLTFKAKDNYTNKEYVLYLKLITYINDLESKFDNIYNIRKNERGNLKSLVTSNIPIEINTKELYISLYNYMKRRMVANRLFKYYPDEYKDYEMCFNYADISKIDDIPERFCQYELFAKNCETNPYNIKYVPDKYLLDICTKLYPELLNPDYKINPAVFPYIDDSLLLKIKRLQLKETPDNITVKDLELFKNQIEDYLIEANNLIEKAKNR